MIEHQNPREWRDDDGKLHRDGGPAVIWNHGTEYWFQHGAWHRTDGPAITYVDNGHRWYINDVEIESNQKFQQLSGLTDEEMAFMVLKYGNVQRFIHEGDN